MKNALLPFIFCCLFSLPPALSQNIASDCDVDSCECIGDFFTEIEAYYFGANGVKVEVFGDQKLTQLIATFPSVNNAQLLTLSAAALPGGVFSTYVYLKVTDASNNSCVTEIFSRCPLNAWPGALEDLDILGKTYGYFTVYSHTTSEQKRRCTIDNINQDWHVGGNVVGPVKNTLGTRNAENVVLISSDLPRGIITKDGKFGLNTQTPSALLDVNGDARIDSTLDVNGITTIHNTTASATPANGALVVTGGAGIGGNANVGSDLTVGNNATVGKDLQVGEDLNVTQTATIGGQTKINDNTSSTTTATGALTVSGGAGIGENLNVGASLKVNGNTSSTNATTGALVVTGGVGIGENLNVTGTSTLTGKVAIATTSTPGGHELYIGGSAIAEEVVVKLQTNWPDYVFAPDYKKPNLKEWEKFISEHGHLPGMPSAAQIKQQDGVAVGETQRLLVEKVEQLLLLILEQQKQIEALQTALQVKNKN